MTPSRMEATVTRAQCKHLQEYGDTYAVLHVYDYSGFRYTLHVPMVQYDDAKTPNVLHKIAKAINTCEMLRDVFEDERGE